MDIRSFGIQFFSNFYLLRRDTQILIRFVKLSVQAVIRSIEEEMRMNAIKPVRDWFRTSLNK
jgi:hypothetical protein